MFLVPGIILRSDRMVHRAYHYSSL